MLSYLVNYGVNRLDIDYTDLDVNDRLALESQINEQRKNYDSLMKLLDEVQEKYLYASRRLSKRTKELIEDVIPSSDMKANDVFRTDDEYLNIEYEIEALKVGMQTINNQIEYARNNLRILNSVFYNKF